MLQSPWHCCRFPGVPVGTISNTGNDGFLVGLVVGLPVDSVGEVEGDWVGDAVGLPEGFLVGLVVGGDVLGSREGAVVGQSETEG